MTSTYPFRNPPLPFDFDALEPFIDAKTMRLHHNRHLQTYIDQLNTTLKDYPDYHSWTLTQLLQNIASLPASIQQPVQRNAGGVFNHVFYFSHLIPNELSHPKGSLVEAISKFYGTFEHFKQEMTAAALSVFGSGYAWLVLNARGEFAILTLPNQDTPLPLNLCPLLTVDVWEHAYYLKHYNNRTSYLNDWFQVVNWQQVQKNYHDFFL